jgi:acetyl/propionyl-CoA carboxylase alpha subunit
MIAKLTVRGKDRAQAIANLNAALAQTTVFGLVTNLPLLRGIARHPEFAAGKFDTGFIERALKDILARPKLSVPALAAAVAEELWRLNGPAYGGPWSADGWRLSGGRGLRFTAREHDGAEHAVTAAGSPLVFTLAFDGKHYEIGAEHLGRSAWTVTLGGKSHAAEVLHHGADRQVDFNFTLASPHAPKAGRVADEAAHPLSPMPGRVVAVHVKTGDKVVPGQALMVLEGMKMEYTVKAAVSGTVEKVLFEPGAMVDVDATLAHIKPE